MEIPDFNGPMKGQLQISAGSQKKNEIREIRDYNWKKRPALIFERIWEIPQIKYKRQDLALISLK